MTADLRPDDENLIQKLFAIPPEDREAILKQIVADQDWKSDRLWQTVFEWLLTSINMENSPSIDTAIQLGRVTERLYWVAQRAPVTGATPETLALQRQGSWRALVEKNEARRADNAWRHADAEEWKTIAREIACRRPKHQTKGGRVEDVINGELEMRGFKRMGRSTIRIAIAGLKRPK